MAAAKASTKARNIRPGVLTIFRSSPWKLFPRTCETSPAAQPRINACSVLSPSRFNKFDFGLILLNRANSLLAIDLANCYGVFNGSNRGSPGVAGVALRADREACEQCCSAGIR